MKFENNGLTSLSENIHFNFPIRTTFSRIQPGLEHELEACMHTYYDSPLFKIVDATCYTTRVATITHTQQFQIERGMFVSLCDNTEFSIACIQLFLACSVRETVGEDDEDEEPHLEFFAVVHPFYLTGGFDDWTTLPFVQKLPWCSIVLLRQILETVYVLPTQPATARRNITEYFDTPMVVLDNQWLFEHPRQPSVWKSPFLYDLQNYEGNPHATLGDISPRKQKKDRWKNKHYDAPLQVELPELYSSDSSDDNVNNNNTDLADSEDLDYEEGDSPYHTESEITSDEISL